IVINRITPFSSSVTPGPLARSPRLADDDAADHAQQFVVAAEEIISPFNFELPVVAGGAGSKIQVERSGRFRNAKLMIVIAGVIGAHRNNLRACVDKTDRVARLHKQSQRVESQK